MLRAITKSGNAFDRRGFRLRGLEMTRLETFVDAAFAFAVTMLALSADRVPTSFDQMYDLLRGIPAFLLSLALLLLFWNGHVNFSRRYGFDDRTTTLLSGVFIAVMLVYVYPLKFMATAFFSYYVPPLRTGDYLRGGTTSDLSAMFLVMSCGYVLLECVFVGLESHAKRNADELALTAHERRLVSCERTAHGIYAAVGVVSIILAIVLRNSIAVVTAGFVYAGLTVLIPLYWARCGPRPQACRDAVNAPEGGAG